MTKPVGVAAIEAAIGEPPAEAEAEQLDLLPPSRFENPAQEERVRRAGRPKGAQNVATRDMLAFVRKTIGDPLLERARWLLLTPAELGRELACSTLDAFDRQDRIRADIMRYCYAPRAAENRDGEAVVPMLQMVFGAHSAGPAALPPWEYESEQNQGLSGEAADVSHGDVSHGEGKPLKSEGKA